MTQARHFSLRRFCLCCLSAPVLTSVAGWLAPRAAFAEAQGIVELIKSDAASSPIKVHKLRGNRRCPGRIRRQCRRPDRIRREAAGRCGNWCIARSDVDGARKPKRRANHPLDQHALAFRSRRWQRLGQQGRRRDTCAREHP